MVVGTFIGIHIQEENDTIAVMGKFGGRMFGNVTLFKHLAEKIW